MARTWPAYDKWRYKNDGLQSLVKTISGKREVTAFVDAEPFPDFEGISFDGSYEKKMSYQEFLRTM